MGRIIPVHLPKASLGSLRGSPAAFVACQDEAIKSVISSGSSGKSGAIVA